MTESPIELSALRRLYASDPRARATLDHFAARQQDRSEMTVDRMWELLASEGHVLTRADVIETFRNLQQVGAGKFVIGRKGHLSRFQRSVSLIELGRIAKGGDTPSAQVLSPVPVVSVQGPPVPALKSDVIVHRYVLRPDFTVTLQLPADLTQSEASRLSEYIKTLPFSS
jgi:hypothetical protein